MKKNKSAFTLMEALIALAIVGILATIITPAVTKQMQRNETGVLLSKAITQVEVGCQNIIQFANSRVTDDSYHDVLSTITGADLGMQSGNVLLDLPAVVSGFWGLEPVSNSISIANIPAIQAYDGGDAGADGDNISSGSLRFVRMLLCNVPVDLFLYLMFDLLELSIPFDEMFILVSTSGKSFCCFGFCSELNSCFVGIGIGGICSFGSLVSSVTTKMQSGSEVLLRKILCWFQVELKVLWLIVLLQGEVEVVKE